MSEIMDELLPKLAVVTQKVNTYTGTDYSSIAALKREIQEQGTDFSNLEGSSYV
jgi:sensitive to high expression protein 9